MIEIFPFGRFPNQLSRTRTIPFISHLQDLKEEAMLTIKVTLRSPATHTAILTIEARWATTHPRWAHLGSWSRHLDHQQDLIIINTLTEADQRATILYKSITWATTACLQARSQGPSSPRETICLTMHHSVPPRVRCGKLHHIMISTRIRVSCHLIGQTTLFHTPNIMAACEASGKLLSTMKSLATLQCMAMSLSSTGQLLSIGARVPGPV